MLLRLGGKLGASHKQPFDEMSSWNFYWILNISNIRWYFTQFNAAVSFVSVINSFSLTAHFHFNRSTLDGNCIYKNILSFPVCDASNLIYISFPLSSSKWDFLFTYIKNGKLFFLFHIHDECNQTVKYSNKRRIINTCFHLHYMPLYDQSEFSCFTFSLPLFVTSLGFSLNIKVINK